jgi:hypothetical protein
MVYRVYRRLIISLVKYRSHAVDIVHGKGRNRKDGYLLRHGIEERQTWT